MENAMKTLTNKEALKVALMAVRYAHEEVRKQPNGGDLKTAIENALKEAFK